MRIKYTRDILSILEMGVKLEVEGDGALFCKQKKTIVLEL